MDPPYMNTVNDNYQHKNINVYEFFYKNKI